MHYSTWSSDGVMKCSSVLEGLGERDKGNQAEARTREAKAAKTSEKKG